MRIIAGNLGGRKLNSPKGSKTHPMSEKVRGAIFNMLGDIEGLSVLDAFAGSGALSFEAISRGADNAIAIDSDKNAHMAIQENIKILGLQGKVKAIRASVSSWSEQNPDDNFDIILCDPPYDNLQPKVLEKLAKHCKQDGLIIYSLPPASEFSLPSASYQLLADKSYGDATITVYRRI